MKTIRLLFGAMLVSILALAPVEVNAHKGHRGKHRLYTPHWVTLSIARSNMRYVYFPDFDLYYDRWDGMYSYSFRGKWIVNDRPPQALCSVNFSRAYMVGIHYDAPRPYRYHAQHRVRYQRYYRNQRHDRRYSYSYSYGNGNGHHKKGRKHYDNDWNDDRRDDRNRSNGPRRGRRN